jgi:hypothetical protein
MHRGVQALIDFIETHDNTQGVSVARAAPQQAIATVEDTLLSPLPSDLRLLLGRYNGGQLPGGILLSAGEPATNGAQDGILTMRQELAQRMQRPTDDADLPVPFFRSDDGALLCFDRSGGPVPDTWPVVDYQFESGELRLVHRTFDGFCRFNLDEWTDPDFNATFSLVKYLRSGERHARLEPDVSAAHATAAHALKRAGRPEEALAQYLRAARCLPALAYCDWEALKLAALLGEATAALEAGQRLSARGPRKRWIARETTAVRVAQALGWVRAHGPQRDRLLRLLDLLREQTDDEAGAHAVQAIRRAVHTGSNVPPPDAVRPTAVPLSKDLQARWDTLKRAYTAGKVRDEDLVLDPAYGGPHADPPLEELLRIRREF